MYLFLHVSVAFSPSRKVNLVDGALGVHQCGFRPNHRKSLCHASFQEMILDNLDDFGPPVISQCNVHAFTKAAAVTKEHITSARDMAIRICFSYLAKQGQERWGNGAQITLNSVVLLLGQMGCDLSLVHKLQGLQTFACLCIVGFSSLPGTPFPYTSVYSGQKRVQLQVIVFLVPWGAPSVICVIFRWKGWNWRVPCETLILEGRAA